MELLAVIIIFLCAGFMALLESVQFGGSSLSQDELERRAASGDTRAGHELKVHRLMPYFYGLLRLKISLLVVVLAGTAVAAWQWLGGLGALLVLWLVGVVVSRGWLRGIGTAVGKAVGPVLWPVVEKMAPLLVWVAPRQAGQAAAGFASTQELLAMINRDTTVLSLHQKKRLLAAVHFDTKTVEDCMVPADKIVTVQAKEAMGPVLLDRLHKAGHTIFPVVKKDLEHIEGLLYMSDLSPLHPDIKTVADATRPKVLFLAPGVSMAEVLATSLKTSRHFFLVQDGKKVVGLITLADALAALLGEKL